MIFTAINKDLTSTITGVETLSNKMGILGNSFSDIFNAYQGYGMAGVKNLFANTSDKIVTSMDIDMLKNFNNEIANGVPKTEALQNTMFGASKGARALAENADKTGVNLQGLSVAEQGYTATTIGARVATVAFQAALTFGIAIAIQGLITLFQKLKESIPTVENTTKWLEESSQEVKDIQDDINGLNDELKTTKDRIDELIKKPSLTIVEQNELDRLQKTNAELERKIQLQERALQVAQGKNSKNFVEATNATRTTKDDKELWDNESSAIAIMANQYTDVGSQSYNAEDFFSKILEAYQNAEAAKVNATEEELKNIEDFQTRASNWMSAYATRLQANLDELGDYDYNTLSDEAKAQVDYINDVLNTYNKLLGNDETVFSNIYNQERFAEAKKSIENLKEAGQLTAETLMSLYSTNDNVKAMIDNMVKVGLINDTTANSFNLLTNQIIGTKEASKQLSDTSLFTIDTEELQSQIDGLKDSIDDIVSAYSNMMSIIDDYNDNGNLTVDNLKTLIDLGDDYIGTLFNESGELELNKDSYVALAKAKLEDIRYSMLEKAISEINALSKDDEATSTDSLADSTGNLTEQTLKLAAARKIAEGVDSSRVQSILDTYSQWNALIDNVITGLEDNTDATLGVSDATDEATDSSNDYKNALNAEKDALEDAKNALEDQKDALEDVKDGYDDAIDSIKDLIDWVQDYIKHVKNDEIDALEAKKDAIDDLIEAQKDLLNAEKDEHDWQNTIADKQNTVAKDALAASIASLDDSSAGKKAQKQTAETLANSRKDIIDELYDHSIDERLDYLDTLKDEQDAYYDEQIDKINDYLNDEVQLYKDACSMIDNDNGTLYNKLLTYCKKYTTTTESEFVNMWTSAQTALSSYNTANLGTFDLLNNLQSRIYEVDSAISTVESSISSYSDAIDTIQSKIDNLSSSTESAISKISSLGSSSLGTNNYNLDASQFSNSESSSSSSNNTSNNSSNSSNSNKSSTNNSNKSTTWTPTSSKGGWYITLGKTRYESVAPTLEMAITNLRYQYARDVGVSNANLGLINGNTVRHYAKGTRNAEAGTSELNENGNLETLMKKTPTGDFVIMNQGDQVYTKEQTDNLHDFSSSPSKYIEDSLIKNDLVPLTSEELKNFGAWGDMSQIGINNRTLASATMTNIDNIGKELSQATNIPDNEILNNITIQNTFNGDVTPQMLRLLEQKEKDIIDKSIGKSVRATQDMLLRGRNLR